MTIIKINDIDLSKDVDTNPSELAGLFPDCIVEPRLNRSDLIDVAEYYAMRIILGASVLYNPNGLDKYVKLIYKGSSYIIAEHDYYIFKSLADDFIRSFLNRKVYTVNDIESNADVFINAMRFINFRAKNILSVDINKVRIFWMIPDEWATGWYRARLPAKFIQELIPDKFHIDAFTYLNYSSALFYDAFIFHRIPSQQMINNFENFKSEGRVVLYDTDDDYFSVPDWSVVSTTLNDEHKKKAINAMSMSDACSVTNENLGRTLKKEYVFECPNLIDLSVFKMLSDEDVSIKLNKKFIGINAKNLNNKIVFCNKDGKEVKLCKNDFDDYNPIKILWFGSNTHDKDLRPVIDAITKLIEAYGISIRFIFFGYCPPEFVDAYVEPGNSQTRLDIKEHLDPCIDYIEPVQFSRFHEILNTIKPQIGLCPIEDNEFNKSKSPIKYFELSALRVPVIASNVGPYKIINNNEDGILIDNNPDEWFIAIERLIRNHEFRLKLGINGRRKAENNSWQIDNPGRQKWINYFNYVYDLAMDRRNINTSEVQRRIIENDK